MCIGVAAAGLCWALLTVIKNTEMWLDWVAGQYRPPGTPLAWPLLLRSLRDSFIQSLYEGGREGSSYSAQATTLQQSENIHRHSAFKLSRLTSSSILKSHALSLIQQLLANYQSSHSIHLYPPENFTTANYIHLQVKLTHLHFNAVLLHGKLCYCCTTLSQSVPPLN